MKKLVWLLLPLLCFSKGITLKIDIEGMTCPLCTTAIKKSLKKIKGVTKAKVKLHSKIATVTFSEDVTQKQLLDAIEDVGYHGKIRKIN